ncbi:LamG domain-containing protein, partial [Nonomuraea sp. NPDC005983]|uniref:LamG domain-containing protein n=1 Tax=Nonomuraea sp. NPDC005983 TaxID=3155595 RepID=UPI0033BE0709
YPSTQISTTTSLYQDATATTTIPANTWTHLAATYDGTTLKLFTNGAQTATKPITGPLRLDNGLLHIGGSTLWGEHFNGLIDEVRIYNTALTPVQLQTDMNTPVS